MKKLFILFQCIVYLLLTSCVTYTSMKVANSQNVPMLTEKHEVRLSAATGTETYGVQGAYAINNSLAVMGDFSYGVDELREYSSYIGVNGANRVSGVLALGYYTRQTAKDTILPFGSFEVFAGLERYYRYYSIEDIYYRTNDTMIFSAYSPFVQADWGLLNKRKCGLGLSCKLGALFFDKYLMSKTSPHPPPPQIRTTRAASVVTFQPALTYRFGWKRFNFQFQLGAAVQGIPVLYADNIVFFNGGVSVRL